MTRARFALVLAALSVAVAAVCRFTLFDLVEFKYDEAQVSVDALALVHQHVLPQTSILTSGGFHNPPLMVYLTAIPLLVTTSPLAVTGFFTALNALAAGGLYLAARRAFGDLAALAAALLFAVGPLTVHYSRKVWAPDAMAPFTVLLFAGLILALGGGQGWGLAVALIALAVLVQLHQAALALLPATLFLLVIFGRRLPWRQRATWGGVLAGLVGFGLLLLPYTVYELRHHLADLRGMAGQATSHPALTFVPWRDLWWLTAGWDPELFFRALAAQEKPPLAGSGPVDWAVLSLGILGAGVCLSWLVRPDTPRPGASSAPKGTRRVAAATLLLLTLVPPLVIMRSAAPVFPHYLVFLTPLLFLLVGVGISTLVLPLRAFRQTIRAERPVAAAVTAGLCLVSLARLAGFDRQLSAHTTGGDYGTPLRYSLQAVQVLAKEASPGSATRAFVMVTTGDLPAVYHYFTLAGIAPAANQVAADQALVLPTAAGAAYLFSDTASPAYAALATLSSTGAIQRLPPLLPPAYTVVHVNQAELLPESTNRLPALRPIGPFTVGSGLTVTAASTVLSGPSGPLAVTLAWSVQDPGPYRRQPIKMFVHLYDAARHTVAQEDTLGDAGTAWQPGDRLITWFTARPTAPLAPGRYTLVAGVYIVNGFHVFPVHGPKGEDLGGEIPLGTLTVSGG